MQARAHTHTIHSPLNHHQRKADKLYFVLWTPPAASGRSKMFVSSQRRSLDTVFTGVEDLHASTRGELAKVLTPQKKGDEDEDAWDPDA